MRNISVKLFYICARGKGDASIFSSGSHLFSGAILIEAL